MGETRFDPNRRPERIRRNDAAPAADLPPPGVGAGDAGGKHDDVEVRAIAACVDALNLLSNVSRANVLAYLNFRYVSKEVAS